MGCPETLLWQDSVATLEKQPAKNITNSSPPHLTRGKLNMFRTFFIVAIALLCSAASAVPLSYDSARLYTSSYIYDKSNSSAYGCERKRSNVDASTAPATNSETATCGSASTQTSSAAIGAISGEGFAGSFNLQHWHDTSQSYVTPNKTTMGKSNFDTTFSVATAASLTLNLDWEGLMVNGINNPGDVNNQGGASLFVSLRKADVSETVYSFSVNSVFGGLPAGSFSDLIALDAGTYEMTLSLGVNSYANENMGVVTASPTMNFNVTAVPIPAAVWLFGSALAGLGWFRRKTA
jgi:hypothetical protein